METGQEGDLNYRKYALRDDYVSPEVHLGSIYRRHSRRMNQESNKTSSSRPVVRDATEADSSEVCPSNVTQNCFDMGLSPKLGEFESQQNLLIDRPNGSSEKYSPSCHSSSLLSSTSFSSLSKHTTNKSWMSVNIQFPPDDDFSHESMVLNLNPNAFSQDSQAHTQQNTDDNTNDRLERLPNLKIRKRYPKQLPYNKILSHVKFVMSGYENPRRGKLKDLAIKMGAKYEASWKKDCTHLICAFKYTIKYKEVMAAHGRIVREHWLQECSRKRQLLDWREYKLGRYPYPESEEELDVDDLDYAIEKSRQIAQTAPPAARRRYK